MGDVPVARISAIVAAVVAAALHGVAAIQPEFVAGGQVEVVPLDQARPAWGWVLGALLTQVAVVLVAALMLGFRAAPRVAAGLLLGASAVGVTLRVARLFQLAATPELSPALGSWVDLGTEALALTAGVLALMAFPPASRHPETAATVAPPPGDRAAT